MGAGPGETRLERQDSAALHDDNPFGPDLRFCDGLVNRAMWRDVGTVAARSSPEHTGSTRFVVV